MEGFNELLRNLSPKIRSQDQIDETKKKLKKEPNSIELLSQLAENYNFTNQHQKAIEYCDKILTLEEAVKKCSSLPAKVYNIKGRGQLTPGFYADLVLFDLKRLKVLSNEIEPRQYPQGIEYVFVNGKVVRTKDEHTKETPGKVLRRMD